MFFAASAQEDVEKRQLRKLGAMLGTYWTREAVQAMFSHEKAGKGREKTDHLVTPLLLTMQPELQDYLRKQFGSEKGISPPGWYKKDPGEVVEGWEQSREEFIKMAGMFTGLVPKSY